MVKRGPIITKIIIVAFMIILALLFSNMFRFTGYFLLTTTNASVTEGNLSFNAQKNITIYIDIQKTGTNVTSATMNLSGKKGLFTGWWFNLNETNTKPAGITMNNTYFWVPDSGNNQVYVYDVNGTYIRNWSSPNTPIDITQNNSNIWISAGGNITYHNITGGLLSSFTPTNCTLNAQLVETNYGISSNDTNIFVIENPELNRLRLCVYTHNGTHVRTETSSFVASSNIKGLYTNTTYFWFPKTDQLHKREQNISVAVEQYTTVFGTTLLTGRGVTGNASNLFLVTYNVSDDADNPTTPGRVYKMHIEPTFPNNTWLEVGTEDGIHEWNHSAIFNLTNNKTANFASAMNNYTSTCTAVSGNCSIPFKFHSDITGIIEYFAIRIEYNDTQNPVVTLTPSTNKTDVGIGMQTSLSCSATDNIGTPTVKILVDGSQVCSGDGSCSYTHTMATSGDKIVKCQALDRENNNATKSVTLTGTSPQAPAPGPAPSPAPSPEPIVFPEEEIKESLPLELTPEIQPVFIEDIKAEIKENKVVINLEERAKLILYFEEGPRRKPRLDMEFSTKDVPKLKHTVVEIKYIDWHSYFNLFLLMIIIILVINTLYKRYNY